eukprot:9485994-Pyramimonas_sp.AAC.1
MVGLLHGCCLETRKSIPVCLAHVDSSKPSHLCCTCMADAVELPALGSPVAKHVPPSSAQAYFTCDV